MFNGKLRSRLMILFSEKEFSTHDLDLLRMKTYYKPLNAFTQSTLSFVTTFKAYITKNKAPFGRA